MFSFVSCVILLHTWTNRAKRKNKHSIYGVDSSHDKLSASWFFPARRAGLKIFFECDFICCAVSIISDFWRSSWLQNKNQQKRKHSNIHYKRKPRNLLFVFVNLWKISRLQKNCCKNLDAIKILTIFKC